MSCGREDTGTAIALKVWKTGKITSAVFSNHSYSESKLFPGAAESHLIAVERENEIHWQKYLCFCIQVACFMLLPTHSDYLLFFFFSKLYSTSNFSGQREEANILQFSVFLFQHRKLERWILKEKWGCKIITFIAPVKQLSPYNILSFINYISLAKYDWRKDKFVLPWMGSRSCKKDSSVKLCMQTSKWWLSSIPHWCLELLELYHKCCSTINLCFQFKSLQMFWKLIL